jgi:hypothetical protein
MNFPILWRRPLGVGRVPAVLAILAGAALIGVICGRVASSHYGTAAIEAMIGLPVLLAVAQRPALAVIALLALVSSIFSYDTLPRVNLPGHPPINVADLLLLAAVGGTIWRRPWRTWPPIARSYAAALIVLLAVASVATIKTSLVGSVQAREALLYYRDLMYLAAALTVAIELSGRLRRTFLNAAIALAAAVSVLSIAAAASSGIANELLKLDPISVLTGAATSAGSTARIRVSGLYLVYAMVIPTLVMVIFERDRGRWLRIAALGLMVGAIGVSLNRNMYVGVLVGLIIAALLGGPRLRFRVGLIGVAAIVALTLIAVTSIAPAVSSQIGKRASTALSPGQVLQSGSFTDRTYELSYALPAIGRHPLTGVGPRQPYGALLDLYTQQPRFFVQNFYIDLATDYGLPTALAFLLIPGLCLWYGVKALRLASGQYNRAMLAAGIGTLVALLLSLVVGTYLQDPSSTAAFAVACGLLLSTGIQTSTTTPTDRTIEAKHA